LPTRISASTSVVDSQLRVPSSSGASVGTVKLRARTLWTTVRPARTLGGGAAARAVPVLITLAEADPEGVWPQRCLPPARRARCPLRTRVCVGRCSSGSGAPDARDGPSARSRACDTCEGPSTLSSVGSSFPRHSAASTPYSTTPTATRTIASTNRMNKAPIPMTKSYPPIRAQNRSARPRVRRSPRAPLRPRCARGA